MPLRLLTATAFAFVLAGAATAQTPATQACPTGQATCVVENFQYLNRVVNSDTLANGTRRRMDRVYQLGRGSLYLMDSSIRNTGYPLRLVGASGTGALPQIYTVLNSTSGNRVGDAFFMENDVTMRNLAFSGVIQSPTLNPGGNANMSNTVVRVTQQGFTLVVDNVVWTNVVAQHIRTDSALRTARITNSIWANGGWLGAGGTNFGAGKGIDLRSGSIDSLVFRNNTFVNYTDRIIRHRQSTGAIGVMIFDHNTILNAVSYHGTLALGRVGPKIQITNNLFLDSFVAGADTSDIVRQEEFNESGERYANGRAKMTWVLSEPNTTTTWTVSNNVFAVSPAVEAFYTQFGNGQGNDGNPDNGVPDNDIIGEGAPLTDHIRGRISNPDAAFVEIPLEVTNRPAAPVNMVTWYRTETGRTKAVTTFDASTDDYDRKTLEYFAGTTAGAARVFNAAYPTSSAAYTAAAGGCPAGDLNWFPSRFAACRAVAGEGGPEAAARLGLTAAPNPVRSSAAVRYTLPEATDVTITVFDVLGRQVASLASGAQAAGDHTATWQAAGAAPGVYVVQLRAGAAVATSRLVVVR